MRRMKKISIGILAGMGPRSTTPFMELLLDQCQIQYGAKNDIDYPHMIVYSLPTPFYMDRENDNEALGQSIVAGAKRLASFGVDYIAIPCNTAHKYFDEIEHTVNTKVLNIIDITLKNIPHTGNTTVLATESTMLTNLYQSGIVNKHGKYIFLDEWQGKVNSIIAMIKDAEDKHVISQHWNQLMSEIKGEGVNNVVIACTDLSRMIEEDNSFNFVDSSMALAQEVIAEYVMRKSRC